MIDFLIRVYMVLFQLLTHEFVPQNKNLRGLNSIILHSSGAIAQIQSLIIIQRTKINLIHLIGQVRLELLIVLYSQARNSKTFLKNFLIYVVDLQFLHYSLSDIINVDGIICLSNK